MSLMKYLTHHLALSIDYTREPNILPSLYIGNKNFMQSFPIAHKANKQLHEFLIKVKPVKNESPKTGDKICFILVYVLTNTII